MEVNYELLQRGCLTARENRLKQERIREATPERKAQHRRWAQSEDGKRSMRERHRHYRATENGRDNGLKWNGFAEIKRKSTDDKIIKKNNLRLCVQKGCCVA